MRTKRFIKLLGWVVLTPIMPAILFCALWLFEEKLSVQEALAEAWKQWTEPIREWSWT